MSEKAFLIFRASFPTDFDGELLYAYFDKNQADEKFIQLNDADCYMRTVEIGVYQGDVNAEISDRP